MSLGGKIRIGRIVMRMSQRIFAEKLALNPGTISRWEKEDYKNMPLGLALKAMEILNINLGENTNENNQI